MIKEVSTLEEYRVFVDGFRNDPIFSDPHFAYNEDNLWRAPHKKHHPVFGVFRGTRLVGLFVFLILEDEKYAEMIVGFSKERSAYEEIFQYLSENYGGFSIDFVLNPSNTLLRSVLQEHGAEFNAVQQAMVWKTAFAIARKHEIQMYSEQYREQYLAMHSKDVYWTGEKVLAATNTFRVLLAVKDGEVAGYLDITHCYDVNEPYDLQVKEQFLGQGVEQELLAVAIELNKPKGLTAIVDADDAALFQAVGFERVENNDSLNAHIVTI